MKRFKFTLQTVHRVRELKSEREAMSLARMQAEAQQAAERVANIEALRNEAVERYLERLAAGASLDPVEMELNQKHFASLNALQQDAQKKADEKQLACEKQLDSLKAARAEVKITDLLREDQKKRHRADAERLENKELDELVITKFARGS